jgi:hypothetical protein
MTSARGSRHSRQTRLREIGESGQAKIAAASVEVRGSGVAAEVEARYLAGAGVRELRVGDARVASSAQAIDASLAVVVDASLASNADDARDGALSAFGIRDASARAVATGAHRALVSLRRALA